MGVIDLYSKIAEMDRRDSKCYSEHIVGKWVDGSDIYEKVIRVTNFTPLDGTIVYVDNTITPSACDVISISGIIKRRDNWNSVPFPTPLGASTFARMASGVTGIWVSIDGPGMSNVDLYITVRYIKKPFQDTAAAELQHSYATTDDITVEKEDITPVEKPTTTKSK